MWNSYGFLRSSAMTPSNVIVKNMNATIDMNTFGVVLRIHIQIRETIETQQVSFTKSENGDLFMLVHLP